MTRNLTYILNDNKEIVKHLEGAKLLYNRANYINRYRFFNKKSIYNYSQLYKLFKNSKEYKLLPAACAQQVLRTLEKDWKAFFKLLKTKNLKGRPKPPKYADKYKTCSYPGQGISIKNGKIRIPTTNFIIKLHENITKILDIKISKYYGKIKININYEKPVEDRYLDVSRAIGIDLGLNNLMTITSNDLQLPSIIINGRILKSINQFYNKQLAKFQSIKATKKISNLTYKRMNKVNDYLHKASRYIINYCIENNIGTIIIGNNKDWKQSINLGKKNNQRFVQIPHSKLISMIQYKAEEYNISVKVTEESYTSKIDHLVNEPLKKQDTYLGKRIKRGIYKSSSGVLINADVNGSIGILRKVNAVSEEYLYLVRNRGQVLCPIRITIF